MFGVSIHLWVDPALRQMCLLYIEKRQEERDSYFKIALINLFTSFNKYFKEALKFVLEKHSHENSNL